MTWSAMVERCRRVTSIDKSSAGLAEAMGALRDVRCLQGFLEGELMAWTRRVAELSCIPEQVVASASGLSDRDAIAVMDRVAVVDQVPELGAALADGTVRAGHVDGFKHGLRALDADQRPQLLEAVPQLVELAARSTVEDFGRAVRAEVRRIQADHGLSQLDRQRRACRAATWVDRDGMWNARGRFDPVTGARINARLDAELAKLEAAGAPPDAPEDPIERTSFLRARALANLIEGNGSNGGPVELMIVLDPTAVDDQGQPAVDWGIPVEIPARVLADLYAAGQLGSVSAVVVHNGVIVHAPGELNLGRATRLANRAQRRALRALYPTCAMAGCSTRFADCDIHHVIYWEAPHNGPTDLANLLPLCSRHHHRVHDHGWKLTLAADRTLTVTYPDGTTQPTGPPRRGPTRGRAPAAPPPPAPPPVTDTVDPPMRT